MEPVEVEVRQERQRQDEKWGQQDHGPMAWLVILGEEAGEACRAVLEGDDLGYRGELVQIAAVAIAAIEAYDRGHTIPSSLVDDQLSGKEPSDGEEQEEQTETTQPEA